MKPGLQRKTAADKSPNIQVEASRDQICASFWAKNQRQEIDKGGRGSAGRAESLDDAAIGRCQMC